ncbi:MAG TPA: acetyl-CoA carboxylase biotin carboxyl carrier protein [Candidatus Avalokitesvara rifleensis]|uniref:acetyl-CoA carboxylase biotin carboxyl carrier protein n=1 Tax=Candidatus Avalokitesvara rifleensis TaxID=3367620 RepID=UPI0027141F89|nr:acetyl-CoA carboxylase biotin carboxyl carrier protein [Candidatus Brocadiales bacterium]
MKRTPINMSTMDKIKELISLMNANDLSEIEIQEDTLRIKVKKTNGGFQPAFLPSVPSGSLPAPAGSVQQPLLKKDNLKEITSPMVGTFYRAATPGAEPHVEVGDVLDPDTVVCVIEAMKIINEIKAEVTGKVVEVLVDDGMPVEFGQPLFRVQPTVSGG